MWVAFGSMWYGYEVEGWENIPDEGAALIVYYHGAVPIDYYQLVGHCVLKKRRVIHSVVDTFLFKVCEVLKKICTISSSRTIVNHILFSPETTLTYLFQVPGLGGVLSAFCCTPGTITSCADDLKAGNLLGLAPGGVYEAQFSDNHYKLEWKRYSFVFHYNIKYINISIPNE